MRKTFFVALISGSLICALSVVSFARGPRGGIVRGPYGPLYDTRSPEWRRSGGNMFAYQQLMQAKMMQQQQQFMLKQMQAAQKLQAAQGKAQGSDKGKSGASAQGNAASAQPQAQSNKPVWINEFGQPVVNHYRRPRNRAPSAKKPATGTEAKSEAEDQPQTRRESLKSPR